MPELTTEELRNHYEQIKSDWEYDHQDYRFPLILDTDRHTLSENEIDNLLAEMETATHTAREA